MDTSSTTYHASTTTHQAADSSAQGAQQQPLAEPPCAEIQSINGHGEPSGETPPELEAGGSVSAGGQLNGTAGGSDDALTTAPVSTQPTEGFPDGGEVVEDRYKTNGKEGEEGGHAGHAQQQGAGGGGEGTQGSDGGIETSKTKLIINYLPQNVTEDKLRNMFSSVGPVESCKLVVNRATGYSYGFGFVNFYTSEDADRAIEKFNGMQIENKYIKVSHARPQSDAIKGANLYIRNLPADTDEDKLRSIFGRYGTIIQTKILTDNRDGSAPGQPGGLGDIKKTRTGFVRYNLRKEASDAIQNLNGVTPAGWTEPLMVKFADQRAAANNLRGQRPPNPYGYPLSAGGPSHSHPVAHRPAATLPPYGVSSFDPRTHAQPHPRHTAVPGAFITPQAQPYPAHPAHPHHAQGAPPPSAGFVALRPRGPPAASPPASPQSPVLFVYNIGPYMDEKGLLSLFGPFGRVTRVDVIRDRTTNKGKGYGFVTMATFQEASFALEHMNGFYLGGRQLQVSFKTSRYDQMTAEQSAPQAYPSYPHFGQATIMT
ncbi:unnamed protein product [Vitrella brassicaformis CCMP3155]|uniref:RRM domain-containing protein n=3 Tax=Vitrella brassicaformis TaxID=1169539 RepID=A0A0G4H3A1_VITBC|nr:unnamed protein product [Vitrella brassicaformis CCMP3155]|eukprot:CEM37940.1 unnamed protein product [Vitrella brassicaformis CCMP3155]